MKKKKRKENKVRVIPEERRSVIEANYEFAKWATRRVVKEFSVDLDESPHFELDELYSVALLAMSEAAVAWDPERPRAAKFTSYIYEAIRNALMAHIRKTVRFKQADRAESVIITNRLVANGAPEYGSPPESLTEEIECEDIIRCAEDLVKKSLEKRYHRISEVDVHEILYYYKEGFTIGEIADALEIPYELVSSSIRKIRTVSRKEKNFRDILLGKKL